jgi:O-antigen ligase
MIAAAGVDAALEVGAVLAALLVAGALAAPAGPRLRAGAVLGALVLTPVLLVAAIWDSAQLEPLRDRPALSLAAAAAGLATIAAAAVVFRRRPAALPIAAVAVLPFRVPVEAGGTTASLLLPLYGVIGAGALAYAVPLLLGRDRAGDPPLRGRLAWLLGGAVVLYAAQAAYSSDFDKALQQVVFFYVPFALLALLLAGVEWTRRLVTTCLLVLVGLAVLFVAIGFVEYATKHLLLNPKVIASNQLESYFRVNALFFDPNIYGRFLALVMIALAAVLLWSREPRTLLATVAALALLWGGLLLTLSQSSFTALLAGLAVLAGLRWGWRRAGAAVLAAVAIGVAVVAVDPDAAGLDSPANEATSGRYDLVRGGVELFAERPLLGWGAGSFVEEYRAHEKASSEQASAASHTIPITVAAEQGIGGLAVYFALLVAAFGLLFRGARRSIARAAVGAAFAALVVHTMLYAAFLEDPMAWSLIGAGAGLARGRPEP